MATDILFNFIGGAMEIGGIILFVVVVLIISVVRSKKTHSRAPNMTDVERMTEYLEAERANAPFGVCKICGTPMDMKEFSTPHYLVLLACTNEKCRGAQAVAMV